MKQIKKDPDKNIKNLKEKYKKHAEKSGIKLNPEEKIVDGIIKALLRNKELKGDFYCPCRIVKGIKERDDEIICPCIFHRGEIELQGRCHCGLFVEAD